MELDSGNGTSRITGLPYTSLEQAEDKFNLFAEDGLTLKEKFEELTREEQAAVLKGVTLGRFPNALLRLQPHPLSTVLCTLALALGREWHEDTQQEAMEIAVRAASQLTTDPDEDTYQVHTYCRTRYLSDSLVRHIRLMEEGKTEFMIVHRGAALSDEAVKQAVIDGVKNLVDRLRGPLLEGRPDGYVLPQIEIENIQWIKGTNPPEPGERRRRAWVLRLSPLYAATDYIWTLLAGQAGCIRVGTEVLEVTPLGARRSRWRSGTSSTS